MWWGPWWFGMWFWPIFMLLMMAVCLGMMVVMMRGGGMRPPWERFRGQDKTARDILDERYARGEITRREYEDKLRDLAG